MSKKAVLLSGLILIVLVLVSCNTYQRCPAYGAADVEIEAESTTERV